MTYRNPDYLALARGKPCIHCGAQDGTVVMAHYCGEGADRLGKGMGTKAHDFCAALLCAKCHKHFDEYKVKNDYMRSQAFLMLCLETMALLLETGEIEIVPTSRQ